MQVESSLYPIHIWIRNFCFQTPNKPYRIISWSIVVIFRISSGRKEEKCLYNCTIIALTSFLTALKDNESYEGDSDNLKIILNFELLGVVNYSC